MSDVKRLNKITFILNLVINEFQLGFFKPHVDVFISDPENHRLMLDVYGKIEKAVKEQ